MRRARVVVASTSAAAGTAEDRTGPVIAAWLAGQGFAVGAPQVVPDGAAVGSACRAAVAAGDAVVVVTGGTGVSPDDRTPEEVSPLLSVSLPGLIDEVRRRGLASTPLAVATRGVAGFAGSTFLITLPGSPGGVADGLAVLEPVLGHLLEQRAGGGPAGHSGHGPR